MADRQPRDLADTQYVTLNGPNGMAEGGGGDDGYTTAVAPNGSGFFWRDFDYSAFYGLDFDGMSWVNDGPKFHDRGFSLLNENPASQTFGATSLIPFSLGIPHLRYGHTLGHENDALLIDGWKGRAIEYLVGPDGAPGSVGDDDVVNGVDDIGELGLLERDDDPATNSDDVFIGRFTTAEVSHSGFIYPGNIPGAGDPYRRVLTDPLTLGTDGVIDQFDGTDRRGEDIILSHVIAFDIEVLEDDVTPPVFVDLGHSGAGRYSFGSNLNLPYGNAYDTWHPWSNLNDAAPFRQILGGATSPDGAPGVAGVDDDNANGVDDAGEDGWLGSDDEIPLRAIQVSVRYLDVASGQIRQVTLVLSLED